MRADARRLLLDSARDGRARRAAELLAALVVVAFVVRLLVFEFHYPGFIDTDTYEVLDGTPWIIRCLKDGLLPCGGQVNQFALLQYLPALAFHQLGFTFDGAARALIRLNAVAFIAMLAFTWPLARVLRSRAAGGAYALALLTSPALWYGHAGHGEILGALAIAALAVAVACRSHVALIAIAAWLAVISKETALPFVLVLSYSVARGRALRSGSPIPRATVAGVGIGALCGLVANLAFNLFRYGGVGNEHYLRSDLHVPLTQIPKNTAALLAGPTGGVLWFWPLACLLLAVAFLNVRRDGRALKQLARDPVVLVGLVLLGLLVEFSLWYGPYGGAAWGPRLLLPWMPGLVIAVLCGSPRLTDSIPRIASDSRWIPIAAVAAAIGLAQLGAMVNSAHYWHAYPGEYGVPGEIAVMPFLPDATCPRYPVIERERGYYFRCFNHQAWGRGIAMWRGLKAVDDVPFTLAILYMLTIAASTRLLVEFRQTTYSNS